MCILVDKQTRTRKTPKAKFWFTCSEQFLRAWTLLIYDKHPSFENNGEEPRMRNRNMSGNRLNTNSFRKFMLAHNQTRTVIDHHETINRYYYIRTELVSKNWCHVYSALVLMARYGEIPCYKNVPKNRGKGPSCIQWNLPNKFVEILLKKYTTYNPNIHKLNWNQFNDLIRKGPLCTKVSSHQGGVQVCNSTSSTQVIKKTYHEVSLINKKKWTNISNTTPINVIKSSKGEEIPSSLTWVEIVNSSTPTDSIMETLWDKQQNANIKKSPKNGGSYEKRLWGDIEDDYENENMTIKDMEKLFLIQE